MRTTKVFCLFLFILLSVVISGCVSQQAENGESAADKAKAKKAAAEKFKNLAPVPAVKPVDPIVLARANVSANPMSWRAVNALGIAMFKARKYDEAALAFEQAIAMFPLASAAETEQQIREARQLAINAQQEANRKLKQQQEEAHRQMQEQQMLSGMLSMMPMMPGATANTALFAQAGQTFINAAMMPSGIDIMSGPAMQEAESSQVLKTREFSAIYANLGQARMALWEDDAALEAFRQAYATDPSRTDFLFIQATILQRNDDLAGAIALYARYMAVSPQAKLPVAWIEIAESCRSLGLANEARNALASTRNAWNSVVGQAVTPATEYGYGKLLITAGFYKEAIPFIQTWVDAAPNDSARQHEWATALLRAGKMDEALKAINVFANDTKSADLDKEFMTYFRGMVAMHQGKLGEAKNLLQALRPEAGATTGFTIAAYAMCGHLNEAKEWIESIENGFSSPDTGSVDWYRLGCVWLINGNLPRAAECANRSIDIQPEYGPALLLKQQLLEMNTELIKSWQIKVSQAIANKDATAAVQILSSLLTDIPAGELSESLTRAGMKYVSVMPSKLRMSKEAQQYYLRAQAVLKNARNQQSIKEALCLYLWALRYAPLTPEIHLSLSSVYATQKQYKKALYHIKVYLASARPSDNLDTGVERYYELQYLNENELRKIQSLIPKNN